MLHQMWEVRVEKKARMAPRFLSGLLAGSRATDTARRRAAKGWRKETSHVLNVWRGVGLWDPSREVW